MEKDSREQDTERKGERAHKGREDSETERGGHREPEICRKAPPIKTRMYTQFGAAAYKCSKGKGLVTRFSQSFGLHGPCVGGRGERHA